MIHRILIVCTGNICRSPMAEALLRAKLGSGFQVSSAGLAALVGAPADPLAVEVMQERGHDITGHRGRQALPSLLEGADLILTMDQTQQKGVLRQYPQLRGRVHKLLQWHGHGDVEDPYMQEKDAFEQAYQKIELGVDDWAQRLVRPPKRRER